VLRPQATLANRYHIIRALKSGGMGSIYLASDMDMGGRPCAIKEMLDRFTNDDDRQEGQVWFAREAEMLGRLRHPCIPEIYDYFIESGRFYLSLEFIEGENLEDRLASMGTPGLPEQQVLEWAAQIADVLHYLHTRTPPIVFRDLKPANVMYTPQNEIRLIDFGIARVFSPVRQATMVGTPGYCPPEQYQGLAEPLSDLYALAATIHHLLTGRDPRDGQPFSFPPVRKLIPQISAATESLLDGALRIDLSERGPRIQEFGRQARRIAGELAQGFVPSLSGSMAMHAPGDPLPPTRMVVPSTPVHFGRRNKGETHLVELPIANDGHTELRTALHSSAGWLQVPDGQLRVPCGSTVRVPLRLDTASLPTGKHRALIELDGNGGTANVPVEVQVVFWLFNGAGPLLVASLGFIAVLAALAYVLIQHG
jgi:serine/threonine-protein kinase